MLKKFKDAYKKIKLHINGNGNQNNNNNLNNQFNQNLNNNIDEKQEVLNNLKKFYDIIHPDELEIISKNIIQLILDKDIEWKNQIIEVHLDNVKELQPTQWNLKDFLSRSDYFLSRRLIDKVAPFDNLNEEEYHNVHQFFKEIIDPEIYGNCYLASLEFANMLEKKLPLMGEPYFNDNENTIDDSL